MAMSRKNGKSFSTILSSIVKKYFHGKYTTDVSVIDELITQLEGVELSKEDSCYLSRVLRLFFLGQLVGLHSLHAILTRFEIISSREQTCYKKMCKKLSNNTFHKIFEFFFEEEIRNVLVEKLGKHDSSWSRELVTAVIDDSIFKQWQTSSDPDKDYERCYGKFFSGQVSQTVWGYQVVTFGLSIDGVFYPMFLECAPKATDENKAKKEKSSHLMAVKFITKWGNFVKKIAKEDCKLPNILFSCDSGYSSITLSDACQENGLVYISVPGKKHLIEYEGKSMSIALWTTSVFEVAEKAHIEKEQALPDAEKTAFTLSFRAGYKCQNRELTFLAIRLKGSNKISVIYTTDKNIKGKTLRRHWFQRTYIEQFFRLLKHTMCIQLSITTTKHAFEVKVLRFAFVGLHMQLIAKVVRKAIKSFRKKGIGTLRAFCQSNIEIIDILEEVLKTPFA